MYVYDTGAFGPVHLVAEKPVALCNHPLGGHFELGKP